MRNALRKFRYTLRFLKAFWFKQQKLIIFGFLIGIISFINLPKIFRFLVKREGQRIGVVGKYTLNELPLEIQKLISDGLTMVTEEGKIEPLLAKSWEVSEDGKEYTFLLKPNIFWQDGSLVLSKDINYNFSDVTTTPLDSEKIKFTLKEPFSPFPSVVSRPVFKKNLIGSGLYKVKKIKKNGQVIEKLNLIPAKDKSKPNIVFSFYPTEEAARVAFKIGEVDFLENISNPDDLKKWRNVKITTKINYDRLVAVYFNTQNEKLGEKSIRQSLAYAIEKRWHPRSLGPISPLSWAYNSTVKPYDYDLKNAKKLLTKNNGDINEKKEPLKEIELSTIPSLLEVSELIKKDWEKLGISTKIKVISSLEDSFQALLVVQEIPLDPDQYVLWHSTQKLNISLFKNPKIDKLLEDGRKTFDSEKRKEIYYDFQRFIVEDTPAIFLYHPTLFTISRI